MVRVMRRAESLRPRAETLGDIAVRSLTFVRALRPSPASQQRAVLAMADRALGAASATLDPASPARSSTTRAR